MKVGESVRHAMDEWERSNLEAAMLHACNAVDGTAKKVLPALGSNRRFTRLLRDNYAILGPMGVPGINLAETRFPVDVPHPTTPDGKPDIADVIYGIHSCSHSSTSICACSMLDTSTRGLRWCSWIGGQP